MILHVEENGYLLDNPNGDNNSMFVMSRDALGNEFVLSGSVSFFLIENFHRPKVVSKLDELSKEDSACANLSNTKELDIVMLGSQVSHEKPPILGVSSPKDSLGVLNYKNTNSLEVEGSSSSEHSHSLNKNSHRWCKKSKLIKERNEKSTLILGNDVILEEVVQILATALISKFIYQNPSKHELTI